VPGSAGRVRSFPPDVRKRRGDETERGCSVPRRKLAQRLAGLPIHGAEGTHEKALAMHLRAKQRRTQLGIAVATTPPSSPGVGGTGHLLTSPHRAQTAPRKKYSKVWLTEVHGAAPAVEVSKPVFQNSLQDLPPAARALDTSIAAPLHPTELLGAALRVIVRNAVEESAALADSSERQRHSRHTGLLPQRLDGIRKIPLKFCDCAVKEKKVPGRKNTCCSARDAAQIRAR